jgi:hypothetical protein
LISFDENFAVSDKGFPTENMFRQYLSFSLRGHYSNLSSYSLIVAGKKELSA